MQDLAEFRGAGAESEESGRSASFHHMIVVGDHQVALPEGVSVAEWALERVRWQNPRIRTFLRCIRLLEEVQDSNYAILHCSPQRLEEIWKRVTRVAELIRSDIAASLKSRSQIPSLEAARRKAELSLHICSKTVLLEIERYPARIQASQIMEVRKLLCVSIGKLHSFLQDTFCEIMAGDPRSLHDSDYFLSRRFPQDIEDAEWLHATVERLYAYLRRMADERATCLSALESLIRQEKTIPHGALWRQVADLLQEFEEVLTPMMREVLALRGIRFDEMEVLDRYSFEVPARCRMLVELHDTAHEITDRLMHEAKRSGRDPGEVARELTTGHGIFSRRIAFLLADLDQTYRDLLAFIPLWIENIEMRRALLLRRSTS